ncbi:MAG: PspC domain-containing protein [Solirubrobacteraceae bacterium]
MSTPEGGVPERGHGRRSRLVRPRRGRLLGGVCGGLADHFGVDPILFRIAFVGLAIFSGIGVVLYLAILLLVPEEGARRAPIHLLCSSWRVVLGIVVVLVAAGIALHATVGAGHAGHRGAWRFGAGLASLALLGVIAASIWSRLRGRAGEQVRTSADRRLLRWLSFATTVAVSMILLAVAGAWLAGIDGQLAAWTVVAVGAALVCGAFFLARGRWLVLPAVAFAVAVAVIAAAHVDLHGGIGERTFRPRSLSEVHRGYRLGAGRLEIDLRDVAFPPGDTRLHVRLGMAGVPQLVGI